MAIRFVNRIMQDMKEEPQPESFVDLKIVLEKADWTHVKMSPLTAELRIYWDGKEENPELYAKLLSHEVEHFVIRKIIDSSASLPYDLGGVGDKVNRILGRKGIRSGDVGDLAERYMKTAAYRKYASPRVQEEVTRLLKKWKRLQSRS